MGGSAAGRRMGRSGFRTSGEQERTLKEDTDEDDEVKALAGWEGRLRLISADSAVTGAAICGCGVW
jgi:hypothetical protein